jgi:peptidoglycan/LPS O-acetylase OafA/YrhL
MSEDRYLSYRADVDGLRAIAVLSVIGFHAFPSYVPGGFVGVDIFFVISGYLISGIIFRAVQQGRFTYTDFYARRIRRIFPALLVVLSSTLVAGWFLLLPDTYKALGKQTMAGAGFASNLLLWHEGGFLGYFDVSSQVNPLLHLWSLGVEEQFYLTWPLIIAFLYKRSYRLHWTIGLLLVLSFGLNLALVRDRPIADFYSPLSRFWELLAGSALAYHTASRPDTPIAGHSHRRNVVAWCGFGLFTIALVLARQKMGFPGWVALIPTVGAVCLIAAPGAWFNRHVLSNRVVVFIGLISYPLYLWHWVVLAIVRARLFSDGAEAPRMQRVAAVALAFALAWLTYELVEKPIRARTRSVRQPVVLLALMLVVGSMGAAVYLSDGGAFRLPPDIRALAGLEYSVERLYYGKFYRSRRCFLDFDETFSNIAPECLESNPGKPQVLLWGDSHAGSLYPGLKAMQEKEESFALDQFTEGACPPVEPSALGDAQITPRCRLFNEEAIRKMLSLKPDIVLIEGDWWFHCLQNNAPNEPMLAALQAAVRRLKSGGIKRVVVFGDLPVWNIAQPEVTVKVWQESGIVQQRTHSYLAPGLVRADTLVRQAIAQTGAVFVSALQYLCNDEGCLLSVTKGKAVPLAWDGSHLTPEGSRLLIASSFSEIIDHPTVTSVSSQ